MKHWLMHDALPARKGADESLQPHDSLNQNVMNNTLYYIHDPMCSWCWGFRPTLDALLAALPASIRIERVLGGLAPDSDQPMPEPMRQMLHQTWKQIRQSIPGTEFNFDFWTDNTPRRSTWPSCRAVIAVRQQHADLEVPMIHAIQEAYYLKARNPSDTEILTELAESVGCDPVVFNETVHSDSTRAALDHERQFGMRLGVRGFPSLVLAPAEGNPVSIPVDYNDASTMLQLIDQRLAG